ncbi:MAG: peptidase S8/S53 subtilisin kexin sedolisin [Acidobacteria bacterium]|nr:peptidase S8/S53 subtilisin kexin sedolisin [Acidobacteriota bacterium]
MISLAALGVAAVAAFGQGASPRAGTIIVPDTNVERPADVGVRAHTNYLIFVQAGSKLVLSSPTGETPGSLGCIYKIANGGQYPNCPISSATTPPSGGSGIIAIVDAYDYPTAFPLSNPDKIGRALPTGNKCGSKSTLPCFTKVQAVSGHLKSNSGWALEAALDIEWAHAMAPKAQIVLVEATSNSNSDLLYAVDVASNIVATCNGTCTTGGTGEVSMSWGSSEFSQEATFDGHFTTLGVVYTAASGDSGGAVIWPSASPNVVSAGGTTVNRANNGNFTGETAWSSSGGGPSAYEPIPNYQSVVSTVNLNGMRGTPDFSFDADPNSGVSVYDTTSYQGLSGWFTVGGTSASSPSLAGIINLAGSFAASASDELTTIYSNYNSNNYGSDFRDITSGSTSGCSGGGGGPHHKSTGNNCYNALPGWDFITGVGTNLTTSGK